VYPRSARRHAPRTLRGSDDLSLVARTRSARASFSGTTRYPTDPSHSLRARLPRRTPADHPNGCRPARVESQRWAAARSDAQLGFHDVDRQVERVVVPGGVGDRGKLLWPAYAPRCGDTDPPARAGAARSCRSRRASRRAAGAWHSERGADGGCGLSSSSSGASGGSGARAPASRIRPELVVISQPVAVAAWRWTPCPPFRTSITLPCTRNRVHRGGVSNRLQHRHAAGTSARGAHDVERLPRPVSRPAGRFCSHQLAVEREEPSACAGRRPTRARWAPRFPGRGARPRYESSARCPASTPPFRAPRPVKMPRQLERVLGGLGQLTTSSKYPGPDDGRAISP